MEEFYEHHIEKVYKFFYVKSLDRHTAEDLTSDTFVRYVSQKRKQQVVHETKYLYGIMRTVWIEFLKQKYKARLVELENIDDFHDYSIETIDSFEQTESPIKRLQPYIDLLPPKQKLVLTMRIFEEQSVSETAHALGKDANYVKTTYQRALNSLRSILQDPYQPEETTL